MSRLPSLFAVACLAAAALGAGAEASEPAPVSTASGSLTAQDVFTLQAALDGAEAQGFAAGEFDTRGLQTQLKSSDPALHARGLARLEALAIAYARAEHGQRVASSRLPGNWAIRPARYDAASDLDAALAGRRLASWTASLPPSEARYGALLNAYAHYRDIAARGGWRRLETRRLKPGDSGEAVAALRRRLAVEDPSLTPAPPSGSGVAASPDVYDQSLADAVVRAQIRYGLTSDGVAGSTTLKALNVTVDVRLDQIRANLERWRWAPRELPSLRVELNSAAATLELYDADKPALGMRAIVGKPSRPTPMFSDRIQAIIFNPPWNVPQDIAIKEIWPKIRKNPGYMAREGFVVKPDGTLQQLPGPKCALGTIKFDLSNRFGVYLHDTPAHSLFAQDSRNLSHGCMRLEKPNLLAERLLADTPGWPEWRVDAAVVSGTTQRVVLAHPVPVFVFYWTAFVDADGRLEFRPDVYGWDAKLLDLLGEGPATAPVRRD